MLIALPGDPPLGVGESAAVPSAAAIANAIFDATGVRMREVPFTPEKMLAALKDAGGPHRLATSGSEKALRAGAQDIAGAWHDPWRSSHARCSFHARSSSHCPVQRDVSRHVLRGDARARTAGFALGNCATCHTVEGGPAFTGAEQSKRLSGQFTPPISHLILRRDLADGVLRLLSAPCAMASAAMGIISIPPFLIPRLPKSAVRTCSRSMPICKRWNPCISKRHRPR